MRVYLYLTLGERWERGNVGGLTWSLVPTFHFMVQPPGMKSQLEYSEIASHGLLCLEVTWARKLKHIPVKRAVDFPEEN